VTCDINIFLNKNLKNLKKNSKIQKISKNSKKRGADTWHLFNGC